MNETRKGMMGHTQRRAEERHGITLTDEEYKGLVEDIQSDRSIYCFKQTQTRSIFKIQVKGMMIYCVYSYKAKLIVTFLCEGYVSWTPERGYHLTRRKKSAKERREYDKKRTQIHKTGSDKWIRKKQSDQIGAKED